jgi:FkbM family methyltransferase
MIDVRNQILESNFNASNNELVNICDEFRLLIVRMTCAVPLKMVGDRRKDGSYPIHINTNPESINVISIGVGNNMIFDEGMASLGATVQCFDHTVTPKIKKKYRNKIKHYRIGVRGERSVIGCNTLSEIYDMSLSLNEFQKTILKIDCEGAEWDVFNDNSSKFLSQFDQICVEFHDLDKISIKYIASKYFKVLKKLEKDFVITYIVANNFTPIVKLKNGISWPFTLELHLLNRENLQYIDQNFVNEGLPNALSKTSSNWNLAPTYDIFEWYLGN